MLRVAIEEASQIAEDGIHLPEPGESRLLLPLARASDDNACFLVKVPGKSFGIHKTPVVLQTKNDLFDVPLIIPL